jgi:hypothetical protein
MLALLFLFLPILHLLLVALFLLLFIIMEEALSVFFKQFSVREIAWALSH